jgi:hypothetical protein
MRGAVLLIAGLLLPAAAHSQALSGPVLSVSPLPPPVNQEGMNNFCVFGNQLYSLGAQLCVPNSNVGLRCVSSEGSKSGGRAFWSFDSKEWPISSTWRCEPKP